jgi:PAS domain S-box-containing protein
MSLHLIASDDVLALPGTRELIHALPFAAYTTDKDGRLTGFNDAAVTLWGYRPHLGEDYWNEAQRFYWSDGRSMTREECPMARTLRTGEAVRGVEAILERPNGSLVHFTPHPTALKDKDGRITGGINVLVDITDRLKHDRTNGHLAAIVESSDDAIISKNLSGFILTWNKGAERLFGYTAEEAVGQHIMMLIPPDRHSEEPGIIDRISRGERIEHYETLRQRKDGSQIEVSLTVSPVRNAQGLVVGASKIARDNSERKRADQAKDLLLHEIKHRVKNTLGTVQAIAAQTFRQSPKQERDAFTGRLRALSNAHDLLTQQDWDRVSMRDMIHRALAPFQENRNARFSVSGPDAILAANPALLLAMALHELATNAVKYGALSNETGTVSVNWTINTADSARRLALTWRENGGPTVSPPERKGFGSTLIERALLQEHGSSAFEFAPEGVVCRLEMQL